MSVYLDNNATTAIDPEVAALLGRQLGAGPQNPSSNHRWGQRARQLITQARAEMAQELGARPEELIFTSGGTEAIQTILRGYGANQPPGHMISSDVEHPAVAEALCWFERQGWEVTRLPAGTWGAIRPEQVQAALRPTTRALVLMAANNETGVLTDLPAMAALAEQAGLFFCVDGVAALGRTPIQFLPGMSAMAFSGHKIHGPQGIGIALVRRKYRLEPLLLGGGQESGRRSGTENVPAICALALALRKTMELLPESIARMGQLRDRLEAGLRSQIAIMIHGEGPRLCNTSHLSFPAIDAETLLIRLDQEGIAVSHGSACSAGAMEPSRVLLAMGVTRALARCAIRFSLSRLTTEAEIDQTIATVCRLCRN
jgi:cysteine desulfurase